MNVLHRTQGQGALWLVFMLTGAAAALVSDALTALSGRGRFRAAGRFFAGVASALLCAATAFLTVNGRLRLYMPAAMLLGAALYRATIGSLLRAFAGLASRFFRAVGPRVCACRLIRFLTK